jgi:hypothetical protein
MEETGHVQMQCAIVTAAVRVLIALFVSGLNEIKVAAAAGAQNFFNLSIST